jgi:hypothetical protein
MMKLSDIKSSEAELQDYYAQLQSQHITPAWIGGGITREPKSKAQRGELSSPPETCKRGGSLPSAATVQMPERRAARPDSAGSEMTKATRRASGESRRSRVGSR